MLLNETWNNDLDFEIYEKFLNKQILNTIFSMTMLYPLITNLN